MSVPSSSQEDENQGRHEKICEDEEPHSQNDSGTSFDLYDDMMGEEEHDHQTPEEEEETNDPSMDLYYSLLKEDGDNKVEKRRNVVRRVRQMQKDKVRLRFAIRTLEEENKNLKKNIETLFRAANKEVAKIKAEIAVEEKRKDERFTGPHNNNPSNTEGNSQSEG